MKRIVGLLLVLVMAAALLAGCAGQGGQVEKAAETAAPQSEAGERVVVAC